MNKYIHLSNLVTDSLSLVDIQYYQIIYVSGLSTFYIIIIIF